MHVLGNKGLPDRRVELLRHAEDDRRKHQDGSDFHGSSLLLAAPNWHRFVFLSDAAGTGKVAELSMRRRVMLRNAQASARGDAPNGSPTAANRCGHCR